MQPKEGEIRFIDYNRSVQIFLDGHWCPYTPSKDVVIVDLMDDLEQGDRTEEILKIITEEKPNAGPGRSLAGMLSASFISVDTAFPKDFRQERPLTQEELVEELERFKEEAMKIPDATQYRHNMFNQLRGM